MDDLKQLPVEQASCINLELLKNPTDEYIDMVHDIMYKWAAEWSPIAKNDLKNIVQNVTDSKMEHWRKLLKIYTDRMSIIKYLPAVAPLGLTSGVWCFYGGLFLAFVNGELHVKPNIPLMQLLTTTATLYPQNIIDNIFNFTLLYVVFDHYMDNHDINREDKLLRINRIHDILLNDNIDVGQDALLITIQKAVRNLCLNNKHRTALLKIFNVEVSTALRQNGVNTHMIPQLYQLPFSDQTTILQQLLFMAEWKGGQTVQSMQNIIGLESTREGYILGACIQLADDIHDVEDDIKDGIDTIATHLYAKHKILDHLAYYTVYIAHILDEKYAIFKIIIIPLIAYTVSVKPYFSQELKNKWSGYSPIANDDGLNNKLYLILKSLLKNDV